MEPRKEAVPPIGAAGALLWLVHVLLREGGWEPCAGDAAGGDLDVSRFAGDVNLLPEVNYAVGLNSSIAVRALAVGDALFVHFVVVGGEKSLRVRLRCAHCG